MTDRRQFIGGALAAGIAPFLPEAASAAEPDRPLKFLLMCDTHVESDFMERGHPVYTCWQPGDHAALARTYEFINADPYCRDVQFALFCGDQINTGYTAQQNFLEEEMKNYFRTLETLDLHRKSRGADLSSFKFVTRPYTCRENTRKPFDVTPPPLNSRVIAIQGNHDTGCREFYRESAFQCGGVRFISFFASYVGLPAPKGHYRSTARISDEAVAFIEREMAAAAADPQIRHIVLCSHWAIASGDPKNFHCPIYDACKENKFSDNRRKVLALAERYGCDLYINGHEHNRRWPFARVGSMTDVNCGTVTDENASFAIVEVHPDKAVFNVYRRAAARPAKDGSGLDFFQLPERQRAFEIPLKPIR